MRVLIVLVAWAALLPGLARADAAPLRVCLLSYDGALADQAHNSGFDLDVGRAVAEKLGRPFQPVWIKNQAKMTDVDDSDLPLMPLAKGQCDAVPSVPGRDAVDDELRGHVTLSRPYYGAGFELVGPSGTATDLAALRGKAVSVQSTTVAHGVAEAIGLRWSAATTPQEQLAALDSGAVAAAIVWGPALGEFKRAPVAGYTPPSVLRWNESFATRTADPATGRAVDNALAALIAEGRIAALQNANHIPPRAPFETVFAPADLRMLQLEAAASRVQPKLAVQTETTTTPIATGAAEPAAAEPAAAEPAAAEPAAAPAPAVAADGGSPAARYEKDPAAVHRGKLIYTGTCGAYCHPASAAAATDAPYLFDCAWKHGGTDQDIFHTITHGVKGTRMVSFAGALSEADIWKVIAFLRVDTKCAAQKPN